MLQALDLGIPVLSHDSGIIGYRISNHKLGLTYNDHSLNTQFSNFKNLDAAFFKNDIYNYMNFQTIEQLKNVLINSFTGAKMLIRQPI
jgi:hypothetical protein